MPKLSSSAQKKAQEAEVPQEREYTLLEPGWYIGVLEDVEERESKSGNDYWSATFSDIEDLDGETHPGKLWYSPIMMPVAKRPKDYRPKSRQKKDETEQEWIERSWKTYQDLVAGRLKGFFEAFGFTLDSDTEEMYGEKCAIQVIQEPIGQGPRQGEMRNSIANVKHLDAIADLMDDAKKSPKGDDDDDF